jgi:hypothetical protein
MDKRIETIMQLVLSEADDKESSAAHSGGWGDGGAGTLKDQVRFYKLGMQGKMPEEWKKYEVTLDPEYQKFLELEKKFGKHRR